MKFWDHVGDPLYFPNSSSIVDIVFRFILEFYTPFNFSGMAEDRIVKFCARVVPRSVNRVITNCPQVGVVKVT